MMKFVEVIEVKDEGLVSLKGQRVTLFCMNYIYTGTLTGISSTCVLLENAGIVFETGAFDKKDWTDYQPMPNKLYVQLSAIESFTVLK
jgi:hypothetical protein